MAGVDRPEHPVAQSATRIKPATPSRGVLSRLLPQIAAIVLLVCAIFLPPITMQLPSHHYQITFDISQSMNVEDVFLNETPVSRLTLAKASAQTLLRELPCGSRVGWSVFTGQRTLTLLKPLEICEHYAGLSSSLDGINGRMRWFNGSSVGKGVHQSLRAAKTIGDGATMLMFTDGHEAPPLRPDQTGIPKTDAIQVRGMLVGVGGDTPVRIPKTDSNGQILGYWARDEVMQKPGEIDRNSNEHLSKLHARHLIRLAQLAKLEYLQFNNSDKLIKTLKQSDLPVKSATPVDLQWIPAILALLCLCWRFIFPLKSTVVSTVE